MNILHRKILKISPLYSLLLEIKKSQRPLDWWEGKVAYYKYKG